MKRSALLAAFLFLLGSPLFCQQSAEPSRAPDGGTRTHVAGIDVLPLPGKPFSGRSTTEWTRTLEDGSVVSIHLFAMVARDSQGRIYRELRSFVPVNSDEQSKLIEIWIFDPVAHARTNCKVVSKRCEVSTYNAPTSIKLRSAGVFDNGKRSLARESIGNDSIDGIDLVGTALACRFKQARAISRTDETADVRALLHSGEGPILISARIGAEETPRVLPLRDGHAIRQRFIAALDGGGRDPALTA